MIKEERLTKLIEEKATIYEAKYNNTNPVFLGNQIRDVNYKYGIIVFEPSPNEKYKHHKYIKNLYETEDDARFALEFGRIEWVNKLDLPTYEEFKDYGYGYKRGIVSFRSRDNDVIWLQQERYDGNTCISVFNRSQDFRILYLDLTYSNYILACRKCKELFLGENK